MCALAALQTGRTVFYFCVRSTRCGTRPRTNNRRDQPASLRIKRAYLLLEGLEDPHVRDSTDRLIVNTNRGT